MPWFSKSLRTAEKDAAILLIRHPQKMLAYQQLPMEFYNDAFALASGALPPSGEAFGRPQATLFSPALVSQYVIPALERKIGIIRSMKEQHGQVSQLATENIRQPYDEVASLIHLILQRADLQYEGFTSWVQNPALAVDTTRLDGPERVAISRAAQSLNDLIKKVGLTHDGWMEINRQVFNEVRAAAGLLPLDQENFRSKYSHLLSGGRVRFFE
ncbi:MAG: hypothetical protein EXR48_05845 [Dehalococcoidia bacterium]|nr:hypothetical protein [Dehalococcoidia bacterium]